TGSFRLAAGTRHLHRDCNFTEPLVETAFKSLRHSCRSELTRQGISLELLLPLYLGSGRRVLGTSSLHVAMQTGPSHHPVSGMFGVWPLRILSTSVLGFWRFIVCAISTMSANPSDERWWPPSMSSTHSANFSKFCCLVVRIGLARKNGMI